MATVVTEEELRQSWRNGQGRIPDFPPGTRFTPAAQDFLKAHGPGIPGAAAAAVPAARPAQAGAPKLLQAPPGKRLVYTVEDLPELLEGCTPSIAVHPSVTLTHAALERLRAVGVRVLPWREPAPDIPSPPRPGAAVDAAVLERIQQEVQDRLGGAVDPALLDAILRRVLAGLG